MSSVIYNRNVAPYYDSTNDELKKGYIQFLAIDGQRLQNRELNVMQGLLKGNFKKVTDKIIEDGSILSGCNFIHNDVDSTCTLQAGEIYINGTIVNVPETTWSYTNTQSPQIPISGKAVIYVDVQPVVVTSSDDQSLCNPAENYESYGDPGGHRLKYVAEPKVVSETDYATIITDKKTIVPIVTIKDLESEGPVKDVVSLPSLNKEIVTRTYDTSGDFIAEGLNISTTRNDNNADKYIIHMSKGRCYVKGIQYTFSDMNINQPNSNVNVDSTVNSESHDYTASTTKYYLYHKYIKSINNIKGQLLIQNHKMVRSVSGDVDQICVGSYRPENFSGLVNLTSGSDTYTQNVNYILEGSNIRWISNTRPISGSSYYVDFKYKTSMEENTDFYIGNDSIGYYISFLDTGRKPYEGTSFDIDYSWYMPRIDLIYINALGKVLVKSGTPNDNGVMIEPSQPIDTLPLAVIYVQPGIEPENFSIKSHNLYRVPVGQLQDIKKRLDNIEYNITMNNLESSIANSHYNETDNSGTALTDSSYSLRNIMADSVVDYSKCNLSDYSFKATVDIFSNTIQLPMEVEQISYDKTRIRESKINENGNTEYSIIDPSVNNIYSAYRTGYWENGRWVNNKTAIASQLHATDDIDITPYYYKGLLPSITCEPNNLTYVEDDSNTTVVWLPNRVIYSSNYVDSIVKVNNNTTKVAGTITGRKYNRRTRTWETYTYTTIGSGNAWASQGVTYTGSTYDYKTTGASYSSSILGEETVETTKSAVTNIAQPYMKAGQKVKIIGRDFDSNSELRFYLDDNIIIPDFSNTRYDDNNSPMTKISDSKGLNYDLAFNTINANDPVVYRPWQWAFSRDYATNKIKLSHPLYNKQGINYYYDDVTDLWYYQFATSTATPLLLNDTPLWAKYISRSAWLRYYLNNLTADERENWSEYNDYDVSTGNKYNDEYSESKIAIVSDNDGYFEVEISIPENTPTGNHTIKVENIFPLESYLDDNGNTQVQINKNYIKDASNSFSGTSYLRHWDTVVYKRLVEQVRETVYRDVTVNNYYEEKGYYYNNDPVAQSFTVSESCYLEGIDVYFSQIANDSVVQPWISVRNVENGIPSSDMLLDQYINKTDIKNSDNPTTNVKADRASYIKFDYPLYVEANKSYAVTLGANKQGYRIYYSQIGEKDISTGESVQYQKQQLESGVMMISSNNNTWTVMNEADIKFILYRSDFDTEKTKTYYIDNINTTLPKFSTFNLSLGTSIPENTGVDVYYSLDGEEATSSKKEWISMTLEEAVPITYNLNNANGMKLMFKVVAWTSSSTDTPIVNFNTFDLFVSLFNPSGEYIQLPFSIN